MQASNKSFLQNTDFILTEFYCDAAFSWQCSSSEFLLTEFSHQCDCILHTENWKLIMQKIVQKESAQ